MIGIMCIDDKNGLMFNHRRQSQDRILREDILKMVGNHALRMNAYSFKQFQEMKGCNFLISEDFLNQAGEGEYCFVEDQDVSLYLDKVEQIIIYHWNRVYPADFYFNCSWLSKDWKLVDTKEFEGSSHEKITKEVYKL